ncbi:hypothetical protein HaLaN_16836 [Haematococcus lacustris]|uniref:Uncharacterized protein n=1 Tax=Haematococcus lacustris TaxID=44745 RepID=A0A699ZAY5_HAELA|nr:hypothetical protein HaLaN_16836 [Haematococcus lacustris]
MLLGHANTVSVLAGHPTGHDHADMRISVSQDDVLSPAVHTGASGLGKLTEARNIISPASKQ